VPKWSWAPILLLLPVALAVAALVFAAWLAAAVVVTVSAWIWWWPHRQDVLVVYSNSPIWQGWFEQRALPSLGSRAVVLNWSDRRTWKLSLAVCLFQVLGGQQDYTPMIMVFRPLRWPRFFRFYQPFRKYKHGQPEEVERLWEACWRSLRFQRTS
jgi:hypothetical protein